MVAARGRGNLHEVGDHAPLDVGKDMSGVLDSGRAKRLEAHGANGGGDLVGGQMPRNVRVFVEARQEAARRTFADGGAGAVAKDQNGQVVNTSRFFRGFDGQDAGQVFAVGNAAGGKRAKRTFRVAVRNADARADFDQRLRKRSGVGGDHRPESLAEAGLDGGVGDVVAGAGHAGEDAENVSVNGGNGQAEGDGSDGSGGIVADAGEGAQKGFVGGHFAAVIADDHLRGLLQVAGAAVIAEAFPKFQELILGGGGKVENGGKGFKEAGVVGLDGFHAGLLEHDFGDPNAVGVAGMPPRQIAGVRRIPAKQSGHRLGGQRLADGRRLPDKTDLVLHAPLLSQ